MNTHDTNNKNSSQPEEYVLEDEVAASPESYSLEGEEMGSIADSAESEDKNSDSQVEIDPKNGKKPLSPFRIMLLTLTNSSEGWKALRRAGYTNEEVASRLFYPMSALAAASTFAQLIFDNLTPISEIVVHGLVVFVSFFLGNFVAHLLQQWFMPKSAKEFVNSAFCQQLNMTALSTLAMFYAVTAWIPLLEPVFFFLPLWTIYALVRASKFIACDADKRSLTLTMLCLTIVASPWIVEAAADAFLPQ